MEQTLLIPLCLKYDSLISKIQGAGLIDITFILGLTVITAIAIVASSKAVPKAGILLRIFLTAFTVLLGMMAWSAWFFVMYGVLIGSCHRSLL